MTASPGCGPCFPPSAIRLLKVVIEPAAVASAAVLCILLAVIGKSSGAFIAAFAWLGMWLLTAAISHSLYEAMLYEQRLHSFIDIVDQNIEAASVNEIKSSYIDGKQTQQPKPEETLGNPVVFTPDLFNVMEAARKRADKAKAVGA